MLIRFAVVITVFIVATLLGGCQQDNQESSQSSTDTADTHNPLDKASKSSTNDQSLYTLRMEIVEALIPVSRIKTAVANHYNATGQFSDASKSIANIPSNINIDDTNGSITVHLKDIDASFTDSDTIQLTPETINNTIVWHCKANLIEDLRPPSCN